MTINCVQVTVNEKKGLKIEYTIPIEGCKGKKTGFNLHVLPYLNVINPNFKCEVV